MTPAEIRALSPTALADFYASLSATTLPVGRFKGRAWSHDLPPAFIGLANSVWRGKVFSGARVVNLLGSLLWAHELIEGDVTRTETGVFDEVLIHYPQLGLSDSLKPVSDTFWLGRMALGTSSVVWFVLEKTGEG